MIVLDASLPARFWQQYSNQGKEVAYAKEIHGDC